MADSRLFCGCIKICPNTSFPGDTGILLRFDKRLYDSSTTAIAKQSKKKHAKRMFQAIEPTTHGRRMAMACTRSIKFLVDFPSEKLLKVSSHKIHCHGNIHRWWSCIIHKRFGARFTQISSHIAINKTRSAHARCGR